jgi:Xaa-Pro aminopeptidase
MDLAGRLQRLRRRLEAERTTALLISHLPNIRYLVGFTGSNGLLLITADRAMFWTDNRYREQSAQEVAGAEILIPNGGDLLKAAGRRLSGCRRVAVEFDHLTMAAAQRLVPSRSGMKNGSGWVEELRAVKEPAEVEAIRASIELASSIFPRVLAEIRPGRREAEIAARLEFELRRAGGDGTAFDTIVASGWRAAHVHGRASGKKIEKRELVVIDYGVTLDGYVSDMTRTVCVGRPSPRTRQVYSAVLDAQLAAIAAVRAGVAAAAVDRAARRILDRAGLGEAFVHSTGHGLGLDVHEQPRIAARADRRLVAGNVITIEPGAYLPGWGGVRIEDVVLVTRKGCEVLTPTPKRLLSL